MIVLDTLLPILPRLLSHPVSWCLNARDDVLHREVNSEHGCRGDYFMVSMRSIASLAWLWWLKKRCHKGGGVADLGEMVMPSLPEICVGSFGGDASYSHLRGVWWVCRRVLCDGVRLIRGGHP